MLGGLLYAAGVMSLCQDLGLDRKVLVLAWKLSAQRQGFFTWEEFQRGLPPECHDG